MRRFSGADALRLGLAHKVASAAGIDRLLDETIDGLLLGAPTATARAKAVLLGEWTPPVPDETLRRLQAEYDRMAGSDEAAEGRASFKEKRKPAWYRPA